METKAKTSHPALEEPVPGAADDHEPHPDYPGLTKGDVKKAREKAHARAEKIRRDAALKMVEEAEFARIEEEEGITAGGPENDMVEIMLDMPVVAYGKNDTGAWIQVDGRRYYNRRLYTLRRKLAHCLLHTAQQMRRNESARKGDDSFAYYQNQRAELITKTGAVVPGGGRALPGGAEVLASLRA